MRPTKKNRPYWLIAGTDICEMCEHPHTIQMLRFCAACDRAICEQCCRDGGQNELLCSSCHNEDGGDA